MERDDSYRIGVGGYPNKGEGEMRYIVHYYVPDGRGRRRMVNFYLEGQVPSRLPLRRRQYLRMLLGQASRQGVRLRLTDLCLLLSSSRATIKRDLREIRNGLR